MRPVIKSVELPFAVKLNSNLTDPIDPDFMREFQESTVAQPVPQAFLETVVVYPGAGHALHWEEANHFATDLVGFVENLVN